MPGLCMLLGMRSTSPAFLSETFLCICGRVPGFCKEGKISGIHSGFIHTTECSVEYAARDV